MSRRWAQSTLPTGGSICGIRQPEAGSTQGRQCFQAAWWITAVDPGLRGSGKGSLEGFDKGLVVSCLGDTQWAFPIRCQQVEEEVLELQSRRPAGVDQIPTLLQGQIRRDGDQYQAGLVPISEQSSQEFEIPRQLHQPPAETRHAQGVLVFKQQLKHGLQPIIEQSR